jgi:peptidoglycan/xylan/chitin deacetylase (PgdA/CDA1 family)
MTTMTDEQILGEIGWTMQIINDLTGLVPAFWRPPYGTCFTEIWADFDWFH